MESINKATRSVVLSACDLVDGTPVLDMKPYVPNYDRFDSWLDLELDIYLFD